MFPTSWFFDESASISEFPYLDEYQPVTRLERAKDFGEQLRWIPRFYGFSRQEISAFVEQKPTYSEIVEWFFDSALSHDILVSEVEGKNLYGDKTPHYVREMKTLRKIFPDAVIIHVVRDGRAVLCSKSINKRRVPPDTPEAQEIASHLLDLYPGLDLYKAVKLLERDDLDRAELWKWVGLPDPVTDARRDITLDLIGRLKELWKGDHVVVTVDPRNVVYKAHIWVNDVRSGFDADLTVRYEDLVLETEETLQRICLHLGVDTHPQMLRYYENKNLPLFYLDGRGRWPTNQDILRPPLRDNIDKWRQLLKPDAVAAFEKVAGECLCQLGYL